LTAAFSSLLGLVMLAITISDARGFIIPDCLSLPAIPAGLLAAAFLAGPQPWHETVLGHLAGAALGGALLYSVRFAYQAIRNKEGLGLGDVKLATAGGAWTGIEGLNWLLLLACLSALAWVGVKSTLSGERIESAAELPFGAFLAPSIWLVWTLQQLARSYPAG